jgi:hypothetical protein
MVWRDALATVRGVPTGPAIHAGARRLDGAEARQGARPPRREHPLLHGVLVRSPTGWDAAGPVAPATSISSRTAGGRGAEHDRLSGRELELLVAVRGLGAAVERDRGGSGRHRAGRGRTAGGLGDRRGECRGAAGRPPRHALELGPVAAARPLATAHRRPHGRDRERGAQPLAHRRHGPRRPGRAGRSRGRPHRAARRRGHTGRPAAVRDHPAVLRPRPVRGARRPAAPPRRRPPGTRRRRDPAPGADRGTSTPCPSPTRSGRSKGC